MNALGTLPRVHIIKGLFRVHDDWVPLKQPIRTDPPSELENKISGRIKILKVKEKHSDVSLAVHMVSDVLKNRCEEAAILTSDTDFAEAIRIVVQEGRIPVTLLNPGRGLHAPEALTKHASRNIPIREFIVKSRFPDELTDCRGREIRKPAEWTKSVDAENDLNRSLREDA